MQRENDNRFLRNVGIRSVMQSSMANSLVVVKLFVFMSSSLTV